MRKIKDIHPGQENNILIKESVRGSNLLYSQEIELIKSIQLPQDRTVNGLFKVPKMTRKMKKMPFMNMLLRCSMSVKDFAFLWDPSEQITQTALRAQKDDQMCAYRHRGKTSARNPWEIYY